MTEPGARLDIWTANVGHGDACVLRYSDGNASDFAVVDSNRVEARNPVVQILRDEGAQSLSFLLLTHPHRDHYTGLLEIMQSFPVEKHLWFPLSSASGDYRKKLGELARKAYVETDDVHLRAAATELIRCLHFQKTSTAPMEECVGPSNELLVRGFGSVEFKVMLPYKKAKGDLFSKLLAGDFDALYGKNLNSLSVALEISFAGRKVVLAADAPRDAQRQRRMELSKAGKTLEADVIKLSHHGSERDNSADELRDAFAHDGARIALISAPGSEKHPAREVLGTLGTEGVAPYCTSLSQFCAAEVRNIRREDGLDESLERYVRGARVPAVRPCQGTIRTTIWADGSLEVSPEINAPCPYRSFGDGAVP